MKLPFIRILILFIGASSVYSNPIGEVEKFEADEKEAIKSVLALLDLDGKVQQELLTIYHNEIQLNNDGKIELKETAGEMSDELTRSIALYYGKESPEIKNRIREQLEKTKVKLSTSLGKLVRKAKIQQMRLAKLPPVASVPEQPKKKKFETNEKMEIKSVFAHLAGKEQLLAGYPEEIHQLLNAERIELEEADKIPDELIQSIALHYDNESSRISGNAATKVKLAKVVKKAKKYKELQEFGKAQPPAPSAPISLLGEKSKLAMKGLFEKLAENGRQQLLTEYPNEIHTKDGKVELLKPETMSDQLARSIAKLYKAEKSGSWDQKTKEVVERVIGVKTYARDRLETVHATVQHFSLPSNHHKQHMSQEVFELNVELGKLFKKLGNVVKECRLDLLKRMENVEKPLDSHEIDNRDGKNGLVTPALRPASNLSTKLTEVITHFFMGIHSNTNCADIETKKLKLDELAGDKDENAGLDTKVVSDLRRSYFTIFKIDVEELEKSVSSLKSKHANLLETLEKSLETKRNLVQNVKGEVGAQTELVAKSQADLNSKEESLAETKAKIDSVEKQLEEVHKNINSKEGTILELKGQIEKVASTVKELQEKIDAETEKLSKIRENVQIHTEIVSTLDADVTHHTEMSKVKLDDSRLSKLDDRLSKVSTKSHDANNSSEGKISNEEVLKVAGAVKKTIDALNSKHDELREALQKFVSSKKNIVTELKERIKTSESLVASLNKNIEHHEKVDLAVLGADSLAGLLEQNENHPIAANVWEHFLEESHLKEKSEQVKSKVQSLTSAAKLVETTTGLVTSADATLRRLIKEYLLAKEEIQKDLQSNIDSNKNSMATLEEHIDGNNGKLDLGYLKNILNTIDHKDAEHDELQKKMDLKSNRIEIDEAITKAHTLTHELAKAHREEKTLTAELALAHKELQELLKKTLKLKEKDVEALKESEKSNKNLVNKFQGSLLHTQGSPKHLPTYWEHVNLPRLDDKLKTLIDSNGDPILHMKHAIHDDLSGNSKELTATLKAELHAAQKLTDQLATEHAKLLETLKEKLTLKEAALAKLEGEKANTEKSVKALEEHRDSEQKELARLQSEEQTEQSSLDGLKREKGEASSNLKNLEAKENGEKSAMEHAKQKLESDKEKLTSLEATLQTEEESLASLEKDHSYHEKVKRNFDLEFEIQPPKLDLHYEQIHINVVEWAQSIKEKLPKEWKAHSADGVSEVERAAYEEAENDVKKKVEESVKKTGSLKMKKTETR